MVKSAIIEKDEIFDEDEIEEFIDSDLIEEDTSGSNEISVDVNGKRVYSITELAKIIGKSAATLRHWEKEAIKDLINVSRSPQGARYYTEHDLMIFKEINHWRGEGFALDNIYKILKWKSADSNDSGQGPFATPNFDNEAIEKLEQLLKKYLSVKGKPLLLDNGSNEEEKEEHVSREGAKRRVEARLKASALREWMKEPNEKRYTRMGLFKRENLSERDAFVEEYVGKHYEEEFRKELTGK